MSDIGNKGFPRQMLSYNSKGTAWRKKCLDWADSKTYYSNSLIRNSVRHKTINYDLVSGILHMEDLKLIVNPSNIDAEFIPDNIQHYSILTPKLNVLKGEESKRVFDYRVVVTNPTAISDIEEKRIQELQQKVQAWVQDSSMSEEEAQQELEKIQDFFTYSWQDVREMRGNYILNHYSKELEIPTLFNSGFMDAATVGEEIYQVEVVGGEPYIRRINPKKIRVYGSGYSNKIEDADMIILEDYWSPGQIIDTFYEQLTKKDIEYLERFPNKALGGETGNPYNPIDETQAFVHKRFVGANEATEYYSHLFDNDNVEDSLSPYDIAGNVRVLRLYWKSKRKIKKVKSYDPMTGDIQVNIYPESYVEDTDRGEEVETMWINQAWEGVKIGTDIYVNMRPCPIQFNSMTNPSRCHFGIIGSIYNLNDDKPYSLVDMMKPYNYLYDVVHDRLNKLIARNWGTGVRVDLAKIPDGWSLDKWMYFAKTLGMYVENSFNAAKEGPATGKIVGAMNNASNGVVSTNDAQLLQQYIQILGFAKTEMGDAVGITPQREGQIANRETVGGVERATLQSSYITEWIFTTHDSVKKRVLNALLEVAKYAMKGRTKKFEYLLPDGARKLIEIDGDEFAECDYGIIVDNGSQLQEMNQKLDMLAQAALQNQMINFSTIMKLYSSASLAEKQRMVENNEKMIKEQQAQQQQQEMQLQQQQIEQQAQAAQQQMEMQYKMHTEDNETKILIAQINSQAEEARLALMNGDDGTLTEKDKAEVGEKIREFDAKLKLEKEKLNFEKSKAKTGAELKRRQINKSNNSK